MQISPGKSTAKIDEALRARVEQALAQTNIVPDGVFLEANSIKVRLGNTDTQLKAKDVLQNALGENYVVALQRTSCTVNGKSLDSFDVLVDRMEGDDAVETWVWSQKQYEFDEMLG